MLPIGMAMFNANQTQQPQPKLVAIEDSDKSDLKKLKAVIMKMAVHGPKERLSAVKVAKVLGEITGLYANVFARKHRRTYARERVSAYACLQEARKVNYYWCFCPWRHNYTSHVTHTPCVDVSYLPYIRDTLLYSQFKWQT